MAKNEYKKRKEAVRDCAKKSYDKKSLCNELKNCCNPHQCPVVIHLLSVTVRVCCENYFPIERQFH